MKKQLLGGLCRKLASAALGASLLASPAVLANPHHKPAAAKGPLKLPAFLSFGQGNTAIGKFQAQTLETVKAYLAAHPEITTLRIQGYYDGKDSPEQAQSHSTARASNAAHWLVQHGVDCKRLIAVSFVKGGDMREGGAYANFVNAGLRGKSIGGAPMNGGGKSVGDVCSGKSASKESAPASNAPAAEASSGGGSSDGPKNFQDPNLSAARKALFVELEKRIPSVEGQPAAAGKINLFAGSTHMAHGTTCGMLPGVLMQKLKVKGPITQYATEGLRIEGKKLGVWVDNDGTTMPKPGDLYWLRYEDKPSSDSVAHVGVIYDVSNPNTWITADAGQGSSAVQEAKLVHRNMKKKDGTHFFLSGPSNTPGDSPALRRIGGWIDLDKLLAKK